MSFFGESSLYLDLSKLVLRPKWLFNPGPLRGAGVLGEDEQSCIIIGIVKYSVYKYRTSATRASEAIPGARKILEKRGEWRNFK